jgi:hypothetical protein
MAKTMDSFARLCQCRTEPRDYRSRKCATSSIINSNLAQGFELVGLGELADAVQSVARINSILNTFCIIRVLLLKGKLCENCTRHPNAGQFTSLQINESLSATMVLATFGISVKVF